MVVVVLAVVVAATLAVLFYGSRGDFNTYRLHAKGKCVEVVQHSDGWTWHDVDLRPCVDGPFPG